MRRDGSALAPGLPQHVGGDFLRVQLIAGDSQCRLDAKRFADVESSSFNGKDEKKAAVPAGLSVTSTGVGNRFTSSAPWERRSILARLCRPWSR
jgi:hypothetical protein